MSDSIYININQHQLVGNTHQPLLVQLEQAGLQIEYQCRNGTCGACRCHLSQGKVAKLSSIAHLNHAEILACRTVPQSNISLEFDYAVIINLTN